MRPDDFAAIGVFVVVAVGVVSILGRRHARVKQRLTMLQQALEHPQLDAQTRSQILAVLSNEHESSKLGFLVSKAFWHRVIFGSAWLLFIFCGGLSVLAWFRIIPQHLAQFPMVLALIGLAVMTLPFSLRELSGRQRQVAD